MKRCTKTMKKCPMTTSGKHIWGTVLINERYIYTSLPKCVACNLIDDRPKKKGKV